MLNWARASLLALVKLMFWNSVFRDYPENETSIPEDVFDVQQAFKEGVSMFLEKNI